MGGGGSRSRFRENKTVLSQFKKKLNRHFMLHEKKENVFLFSTALFVFFIIRLLRVLRDVKRKPSSEFYISHLVQPRKLVVLVNDLGHLGTRVDALPPLGSK